MKGKSLPITVKETDHYADYGLDNINLNYRGSKGEKPVTLVFSSPVEHGQRGHFDDTTHFGHSRVVVTTESNEIGRKPAAETLKVGKVADQWHLVDKKTGAMDETTKNYDDGEGRRSYFFSKKEAQQELAKRTHPVYQAKKIGNIVEDQHDVFQRNSSEDLQAKILAQDTKRHLMDSATLSKLQEQEQQFLHLAKNGRYKDITLRKTLQYLKEQGVEEVRYATPSTVAKIEGYVNDENRAPYNQENGDPFRRDSSDLTHGDKIEYLGEDYTVVETQAMGRGWGGPPPTQILVAPSDKVHTFSWYEHVATEAQYHWDEQAKSDFEPLATKGGDITPQAAQEFLDKKSPKDANGTSERRILSMEYWGSQGIIEEIARGDKRWSMSDVEEAVKEHSVQHEEFSNLEDIYGKDNVFISKDDTVYTVDDDTHTEALGQPSSFSDGPDPDELPSMIDPEPGSKNTTAQRNAIDQNFDETQATVLKEYLDRFDRLQKLTKEENVPLTYEYGDNDNGAWYTFPLTKVRRNLCGN